jgi:hypothetical protein
MAQTNSAEVAEARAARVPDRPAGTPEPAIPGDCYRIEPGETGPEFFAPDLAGCEHAMTRARRLSAAGPAQHVTRIRPGARPRTFRWYSGGTDISPVAP